MPPLRADAIVVCSCGQRWGNWRRASLHEDLAAVEDVLLATYVPVMIRHHRLGHRFQLGDNAPRSFLGVIAKVAARMAAEAEAEEAQPGERLAIDPVRGDDA